MSKEALKAAAIAHCKATGVDFKAIESLAMENMRQAIEAYEAHGAQETGAARAGSQVERVARAIANDIKRQFNGHPIPGVPPQIDSWTATGGTLECEEIAQAAIAAMPSPEVASAARRINGLDIEVFNRNKTVRGYVFADAKTLATAFQRNDATRIC